MKDWLKGLLMITVTNVVYYIIPVWTVDFLTKQPNPLYSLGEFLKNFPSLQDILSGNFMTSSLSIIIGLAGVAIIGYGIFLFVRDVYRGN